MSKKRTKIFLDLEFTGLHKLTTPISIALVAEDGNEYYAEFTDYDKMQVDNFLRKAVLPNLILNEYNFETDYDPDAEQVFVKGDSELVKETLTAWLSRYKERGIEIWGDTLAYDWILFVSIFGNAFDVPEHVFYIPMDIATALKCFGEDPDVSREQFAYSPEQYEKIKANKHNALFDARTQMEVFKKLLQKGEKKEDKKEEKPAEQVEATTEAPKQIEATENPEEEKAEEPEKTDKPTSEEELDEPDTVEEEKAEEPKKEMKPFIEPTQEQINSTTGFNPPL